MFSKNIKIKKAPRQPARKFCPVPPVRNFGCSLLRTRFFRMCLRPQGLSRPLEYFRAPRFVKGIWRKVSSKTGRAIALEPRVKWVFERLLCLCTIGPRSCTSFLLSPSWKGEHAHSIGVLVNPMLCRPCWSKLCSGRPRRSIIRLPARSVGWLQPGRQGSRSIATLA